MIPSTRNQVVILKPSKYRPDGTVERFQRGFMPNSTPRHLQALTPDRINGLPIFTVLVDEYVETDLAYLNLLNPDTCLLLALCGVQSHQYQRALDLAAYARAHGVANVIIGGPHPMTCRTDDQEGRGVSFACAEAEVIWDAILRDAANGQLQPTYGNDQRWQRQLITSPLTPPTREEMRRYVMPMLGIYCSRGCPYNCTYCSVTQIAGRKIRNESQDVTIATIRAAKDAGVRILMFTSDNFNKITGITELLERMIGQGLQIPFFAQCDTQVHKQPELLALAARAGCFMVFLGAETFDRRTLRAFGKHHNFPEHYARIVQICEANGILAHFSNMIGFPSQQEPDILEHLERLLEIGPAVSSWYIVTPIPGTAMYDEYMAQGLITGHNLDRYDGTHLLWNHPHLSEERLQDLLFRCYDASHQDERVTGRLDQAFWDRAAGNSGRIAKRIYAGYRDFVLQCVAQRWHPMSGGVDPMTCDCATDYAAFRHTVFGVDSVPLPQSRYVGDAEIDLLKGV